MLQYLSRLRGTLQNIFGIGGTAGINIKNSSGIMQARNGADNNWASMEGRDMRVHGTNPTNYAGFQAGAGMSGSVIWSLPLTDGSSNQVLGTNGAGTLIWLSGAGGSGDNRFELAFDETTGTQDIFTPTDNDKIVRIVVVVDTSAAGGSPSLVIGVSGDTSRYVTAADAPLTLGNNTIFEIILDEDVGTTPPAIQAVVTGGGQVFSGTIYVERDPS